MTKKGLLAIFIALSMSLAPMSPVYSTAFAKTRVRYKTVKVNRAAKRTVKKKATRKTRKTKKTGKSSKSVVYSQSSYYIVTIPSSKKKISLLQRKLTQRTGVGFNRASNYKLQAKVNGSIANVIVAVCKKLKVKAYVTKVESIVINPPYRFDPNNLPVSDAELRAILENTMTAGDDGQVTIVIDAGHGGAASGAVAKSGLREKDVNLDVALKVRDYFGQINERLRAHGFTKTFNVVLTRTGDNSLVNPYEYGSDLQARVDLSAAVKADVFISIHHNGSTSPDAVGTQVYYRTYDNRTHENYIGYLLAMSLQQELTKAFGWSGVPGKDDGIAAANYWVLRRSVDSTESTTSITGVAKALTESAYMSNAGEAALLATDEFRAKEAAGIINGALVFLRQVLRNTGRL